MLLSTVFTSLPCYHSVEKYITDFHNLLYNLLHDWENDFIVIGRGFVKPFFFNSRAYLSAPVRSFLSPQ